MGSLGLDALEEMQKKSKKFEYFLDETAQFSHTLKSCIINDY